MPAASAHPATLAIEHDDDGFVTLSFAVPDHRQNVLTPGVLADLAAALDDLEARPPRRRPRGLVLRSARAGSFFAGADVGRIDEVRNLPEVEIARLCDAGRALFARLSRLPWP
jgi:enoyl-CoA hydratase/carnithine racemase